MIRSQAPMRLDSLEPDVPARLADVVARAMHREPTQRFASAQAFAEALGEVENDLQRTEVNKVPPTTGDFAKWAPTGVIRDAVKPEAAGKPISPEASGSDVRPVMRPAGDGKIAGSVVQDVRPDGKTEASIPNPFASNISPTINEKPPGPTLTLPEPPPSDPSMLAANLEKTTVTSPPPR